jgi:hypothetical protein
LTVVTPGGFTRLLLKTSEGVTISTGRVDQFLSTTIPAVIDDAVAGIARTSKYDLTLPQVQSLVPGDKENSIPVLEYHRSKEAVKPDVVCPVSDGVRRYQFEPENYEPSARPTLHSFMQPLVDGSFAPDRTASNERECISSRVEAPRPPILELKPFLTRCIDEFLEKLIPEPHMLHPTDHDEVLDRQNRPAQRRLIESSYGALQRRIISMFLKAESYADVKPPRPISTINTGDKVSYSRYIYALETILKKQKWYAFGRTPRQIARRVVEILAHADFASPTDFSKYDGHGSNVMRYFERCLLLRAFHPSHHEEVIDLHSGQFNLKAYGMFATMYYTDFSRASGSPETSVFNTIFNAFVAFLAARMIKVDGLNLGPDEAYNRLGIYGGDDGLSANIPAKHYLRAARLVGQDLTIEIITRGSFGIKFLARIYSPDVWFGEESNCCDIPRQVAKLHTTVNLPSNVTPLMKLREKVRSYSLTDANTPIIGEFCTKFLSLHGPVDRDEKTFNMRTWLSKFDITKQYKNESGEWMTAYVARVLPEFDLTRFRNWLARCTEPTDLLFAPLCMNPIEPTTKKPVVVNGEVFPRSTRVRCLTIEDMPEPDDVSWPPPTQPSTEMLQYLSSWDSIKKSFPPPPDSVIESISGQKTKVIKSKSPMFVPLTHDLKEFGAQPYQIDFPSESKAEVIQDHPPPGRRVILHSLKKPNKKVTFHTLEQIYHVQCPKTETEKEKEAAKV